MKYQMPLLILSLFFISSCAVNNKNDGPVFKDDVSFLKNYTQTIILSDAQDKAKVAVCPDYQGRVMTSTATGPDGNSYGWINRGLIESKENNLHINALGGEDRFWMGPEGGQFSIFFKKDTPFTLENWFTPPDINEASYKITEQGKDFVQFEHVMQFKNYSDFVFDVKLDRMVKLLTTDDVKNLLNISDLQSVDMVAFQSENTVTNVGKEAWNKETGLLSIWILGMFNPSPASTIIVPLKPGPEEELGPIVNDAYFGEIPSNRLVIQDSLMFFSGDGQYRSKIGISQKRCKEILGSYDAEKQVLTIAHLTLPEGEQSYVNSMWELQEQPYNGDVVNSYNDGPSEPGKAPLGPFYELETSSPAAQLEPMQSLSHQHTTIHFQGSKAALDKMTTLLFNVSLENIENALK